MRVLRLKNRDDEKIEVTDLRCREREEDRSSEVQLARNSPRSLNNKQHTVYKELSKSDTQKVERVKK